MTSRRRTPFPIMREDGIQEIEVHVAALCLGTSGGGLRVLALHRAASRRLYPGYWEGVGGQVHPGESFEAAVLRHLEVEAGLSGSIQMPFTTYLIRPGRSGSSYAIPGVRFLVTVSGTPTIRTDPRQHQGSRWIAPKDLESVRWIPGLISQIQKGIQLYRTGRIGTRSAGR